jgi:hypothetical protein
MQEIYVAGSDPAHTVFAANEIIDYQEMST